MSSYTRSVELDLPYDTAVERVKAALAEQGFGVLTEIDVRATLKGKLDVDTEPYVILGACNPPLAKQALDVDRRIGALLPCNVVVRADGDRSIVDAMDPDMLATVSGDPALEPIAHQVRERIEAALASLTG